VYKRPENQNMKSERNPKRVKLCWDGHSLRREQEKREAGMEFSDGREVVKEVSENNPALWKKQRDVYK